ncbi:phospholipase A2 [Thozetella sp. PMI_491]|nr:phospholipase A2 [Thozetella sp. PMI_491]
MSAMISRLSPIPAFPEYTGPHKVGTVDVEIPVSELDAPSETPDCAADIHTVQYRIYYPAVPEAKGKRITWLPAPQRLHVSGYTQFLGIGPLMGSVLSLLPRHLHYTSIPVHKNATLADPTETERWPTVIFSHGLGGSRNAYSHLAGSLASHGVVVICPEHRDGSSVVSLIRDPSRQDRFFIRNTRRVVPYTRIPHSQTSDVWEARNTQMRIRLWELGLVMEAVSALDLGMETVIGTNMNGTTPWGSLAQFTGKLDIHEPGRVIFAGHSFGAATTVQLLKSTYYAGTPELEEMTDPLFVPRKDSAIARQITEKNPTILLDMWCFPLLSKATAPLLRLPLPIYADKPSAPGGNALLAVESEAFYKWKEHLHAKARILSPDPTAEVVSPTAYERPLTGIKQSEPNFFYVENSAHLNQSDFGILFPWLTKKVFGAEQPERALRLNLRAQLQFLRANNVPVARTWVGDLVDGAHVGKMELGAAGASGDKGPDDGIHDDKAIFDRSGNMAVDAWRWIDIVGMGDQAGPGEIELLGRAEHSEDTQVEDGERCMQGEIDPGLAVQEHHAGETARAVVAAAAA